jgi:hypothetical protein
MARKKTEAPKMPTPTATTEELRIVRLQLPATKHDEFRILAAKRRTNMALLARRVILDYIEQERKGTSK